MKRQARLMLISFRIQKVGKTTTVHMSRRRKKIKILTRLNSMEKLQNCKKIKKKDQTWNSRKKKSH